MTSFLHIQRTRAEALVRRWIADPAVVVISSSPAMLGRQHALHVPEPAPLRQLGRRRESNVLVVERSDRLGREHSLWVAKRYGDYRGAYRAFIRAIYGIDPGQALAAFAIDHVLNRARAPREGDFVRLEAVPEDVNSAWGSLFERRASQLPKRRSDRSMDYLICAKIAGLHPPSGSDDRAGVVRLANHFRALGHVDTPGIGTIEDEIADLLRFYERAADAAK